MRRARLHGAGRWRIITEAIATRAVLRRRRTTGKQPGGICMATWQYTKGLHDIGNGVYAYLQPGRLLGLEQCRVDC